jgi:rod shape-determining protein MreD
MRPLSHQLMSMMPALLAVMLLLCATLPISLGGVTVTPNIAWLMTLVMVAHHPAAWPGWVAFALGLMQDFLFGTPLGAQALIALLLAQLTSMQAKARPNQPFRLRWLEAAGVLLALHLALWVIVNLVQPGSAALLPLMQIGLINALWYPVFYRLCTRVFATLPDAK